MVIPPSTAAFIDRPVEMTMTSPGLENFAVYAVVYAAYFFPWRLLRKPAAQPVPISMSADS